MEKELKIILSLLLVSSAFAHSTYYPSNFTEKIDQDLLQNEELRKEISNVLNSWHRRNEGSQDTLDCSGNSSTCYRQRQLSYKEARQYMFGDLDLQRLSNGSYAVKDVYCNKTYRSGSSNVGKIGPMMIPNHQVINCEHTWPQSKFSRHYGKNLQKGDLHHLYPTDSKANSLRSSFEFGYAPNGKSSPNCNDSKLKNSRFEPPHEHKGNVARAVFYFSVRYRMPIKHDVEQALKQWHQADPVDGAEAKRNERIYEIQGNRNPFIDYPELVTQIRDF